ITYCETTVNCTMLSPATLLRKINITNAKSKPFRVVVLGQNGVGKTALTVRFLTRRYIGDYDPLLERVYTCQRTLDGISVEFEVWDTAGQNENNKLKEQIRWADAIILVYDVTDRCSFNECSRLKFLTNALSKRARKKSNIELRADSADQLPVFLVGNKIDKEPDRMVSEEEGETRCKQLGCVAFREVSVSEMVHEVAQVFEEIYVICKYGNKISLHFQLSASRHTLCVERPAACSSSEEDLAERDAISLPGTPESHMNVRDAIASRKLRPEDVYKEMSVDDMWVRSRSKRREAMFMS
ncbi:ras-related and estrogen-regulated growth inhibitor-like isoform X1, partial [Biomphalaria glabrata]